MSEHEVEVEREPPPEPTLARTMGPLALIIYGVGDMLGAGIYGLVGRAAGLLGNTIWIAFLASMLAALTTGLSYASLGSRYPRAAGGAYVTLRASRRRWLAYMVGLSTMASGMTSMAAASRVFAGYFGAYAKGAPAWIVVVGFLVALTLVNLVGMRQSTWLNTICTAVEVSGLAVVLAVGARFWGSVDYLDARTAGNPAGDLAVPLVLGGAVLTFYSFIGFEDILNVAEEVKEPRRTIPLGLITALVITTAVYMAIAVTSVSVVPSAELARSDRPLVDVVTRAAPWFPAQVYTAIALFAVTNTALLNFIMGSRMAYGMARQGLLPRALGRVHATRRTPYVAILALFCVVLALALPGDISTLARATSVLLLLVFAVVNVSLIVLKRRPDEPRGAFEIPIVIPALGFLVNAALVVHAERGELIVAGVMLAAIAGLYLVLAPRGDAIARLGD